MRGEYDKNGQYMAGGTELPPHARRIHVNVVHIIAHGGTTSACAENTDFSPVLHVAAGNYLRMRGEYAPARALGIFSSELPPHARRIRAGPGVGDFLIGTTSACAENTKCAQ